MCYAYKSGNLPGILHYAKDRVRVLLAGGEARPMRWDLIPRGYLQAEKLTVAEAIGKKNSRAINPATGKSWGFSSYNARIETVEKLWTFKEAWQDCNRGVIDVMAFHERPNMDGAPEESKGREYEITLDRTYYLAALFDTWKSKDGETLESCTVITGPSDNIPTLHNIWHERTPILLSEEDAKLWVDPATTPKAAMALLRAAVAPNMTAKEVPRATKVEKPPKVKKAKKEKPKKDEGQTALEL